MYRAPEGFPCFIKEEIETCRVIRHGNSGLEPDPAPKHGKREALLDKVLKVGITPLKHYEEISRHVERVILLPVGMLVLPVGPQIIQFVAAGFCFGGCER